jgi:hypothetical protein
MRPALQQVGWTGSRRFVQVWVFFPVPCMMADGVCWKMVAVWWSGMPILHPSVPTEHLCVASSSTRAYCESPPLELIHATSSSTGSRTYCSSCVHEGKWGGERIQREGCSNSPPPLSRLRCESCWCGCNAALLPFLWIRAGSFTGSPLRKVNPMWPHNYSLLLLHFSVSSDLSCNTIVLPRIIESPTLSYP